MKKPLLFIFLLSLISTFISAESYYDCDADAISEGASRIIMNTENGTIKFIKLDEPIAMRSDQMEAWLKGILGANTKTGFRLYQQKPDKLGFIHYRFRQTYDGYDVNNAVYYVHTLNGKIISANGEFFPNIELNVSPVITIEGAIAIGKEYIHGHKWAWAEDRFPIPEINVARADDGYHLTYKTDIYSFEPVNRKWLMIDVVSGKVVAEYNRIHTSAVNGEAHCKYHGVQTIVVDSISPTEYRLRDATRGAGIETYDLNESTDQADAVDFTDDDNIWDTTTNDDDAALDAHWGAEGMYDYFLNVHGHDSYDGLGSLITSYVHSGVDFANAFWDGSSMTYGDGDGIDWLPLTSTEVVGHEIMHGVTEFTAGLIYANESGALNESYSDCFGTILDFELNPLTANYRIGDDFMLISLGLRNMADPNEFENPDTYGGLYWDFNEVHNWSGVHNYFFYLLTAGGSGTNDIGDDFDVTGIDMADAADILFRSLSVYMTPGTSHAEARDYHILSAEELYGACTQQVISVTDAWYAVGVGEPFVSEVIANFSSNGNFYCQPQVTVEFTNASINANTYEWDLGNGTTSTDANPTATYNDVGEYTVTLIATGATTGLCAGADTLVFTNLITVTNGGGPVTPTCAPEANFPTGFTGVFNFNLSTINNPTGSAQEGYQDYTCTFSALVTEGVVYPFSVETGNNENIRIWIDLDGDGVFNTTNEFVYSSPNATNLHEATLLMPGTTMYDTPLRLRIKSDFSGSDLSDPCGSPQNGQVEDYTISISQNTMPPATNFVADQTVVLVGSTVQFTDLTQNLPESWSWDFPGGDPATSTEQHPSVTYPTIGIYPVTLTATNIYGNAVEVKTDYIDVSQIATMCTNGATNAATGIFYDSGGPGGSYGNSQNCEFLIQPDCALDISMEFTAFSLEPNFDYIYIYDGADASAPLIGSYTGGVSPGTVTATSGQMFIVFDSDGSVTFDGWEANWIASVATAVPIADFSMSNNNTPLNVAVDFTDLSTEFPSTWMWDFGDGNISTEQNPSHAYIMSGTYTVELTVENCFGPAVITYTIVVQPPPAVSVDPSSIDITLECGESETVDVTVTNNGVGDLVFEFGGGSEGGNSLEAVKERLNVDFSTLTDLMPNFFEFFEGEVGNSIGDGGGDMYDNGNMLSVEGGAPFEYSNDVVVADADLGTDGQYFTRKYPGLFVFAADINDVDLFSIDGNLGADGSGSVAGAELTVSHGGSNYKGFVKRVYDAFDPSINHLIIVKDNGTLNQTIPATTDFDDHDISGLTGSERIYYLLFAETDSGLYSDEQMEDIMTQFLLLAEVSALDVVVPTGTHVLTEGTSETFQLTFFANGTDSGVYTSVITINSNDPSLGGLEIPVSVTVTPINVDFQFTGLQAGMPTTFTPDSPGATSWLWDFGDGNSSTEEMPTHIYNDVGDYTITLTVTNGFGCTNTVTSPITILLIGIEELESEISLYPNPTNGNIYIKNTGSENYYEIEVVNTIGQVIKTIDTRQFAGDVYHLHLENYATGMYVLKLKFEDNQVLQKKFVLHKEE